MKKNVRKIVSLFFVTFMIISVFAQNSVSTETVSTETADKAFKILDEANHQLALKGDCSYTLSLVVEKPGKTTENLQFKIFERTDTETFTMVQIFPDADKGKGYLKDGDNLWNYDPISRKFSHSSLKEAIGDSDMKIDDMSNTDAAFRKNYKVTGLREEKLGKYDVYVVSVDAISSLPAYEKTNFYIRKDIKLILKRSDFSASGRLMRTTLVPKYAKTEHGYIGYQALLRDELNPGEQTQQIISDISFESLPDKIFTKAYLEGLN